MSYDLSGVEILDALREGRLDDIEQLLNTYKHRNLLEISDSEKWNWLHKAANSLNANEPPMQTIIYLIKQGIPINAQDIYGMTPLHYALRAQNAEAAIALLEAGADPNIPNRDNIIPLAMIGRMPYRLDVLELMLKKGGNVHYLNGNNDIDVLEFLKTYRSEDDDFKPVIRLMEQYA